MLSSYGICLWPEAGSPDPQPECDPCQGRLLVASPGLLKTLSVEVSHVTPSLCSSVLTDTIDSPCVTLSLCPVLWLWPSAFPTKASSVHLCVCVHVCECVCVCEFV